MNPVHTVTGRRLPNGELEGVKFAPGDYMLETSTGMWWLRPPFGHVGTLDGHTVTEHEDGTISVSPSIHSPGEWHGYLERGIWRRC